MYYILKNEDDWRSHSSYYLPKVEVKDCNVITDGQNFFDRPINNGFKIYKNIRKTATDQGDYYATGCLLDYSYFKENYKMIEIDLGKQQTLGADPTEIEQINFTANLEKTGNAIIFIIEEAKETVLGFSQGTVKVFWMCYRIQFHWII